MSDIGSSTSKNNKLRLFFKIKERETKTESQHRKAEDRPVRLHLLRKRLHLYDDFNGADTSPLKIPLVNICTIGYLRTDHDMMVIGVFLSVVIIVRGLELVRFRVEWSGGESIV